MCSPFFYLLGYDVRYTTQSRGFLDYGGFAETFARQADPKSLLSLFLAFVLRGLIN